MNKLKEMNGKFYQECEVVMLTTEKASIILSESNILIWDKSTECLGGYKKDCVFTPQHLYFLSNEKIKDGDWYYDGFDNKIHQSIGFIKLGFSKKIIATTDTSLGLPQPSKSFIQAYIKAYNEGKPITNVLVEYWAHTEEDLQLKVNSSNKITIKKVKDSYTREEVVVISLKMQHDYSKYKENCHYGPNMREIAEWTDNWLEENL